MVFVFALFALWTGFAFAADEILIGDIQDLSGPNKAFGLGTTNGAGMYKEKINAAGGIDSKKIRIISYDTKSEVNEAINAYRRLCDFDRVAAVLGPPIANIGIALAPISETKKIPMIGLYMDERATIRPNGKPWTYMFMAQNSTRVQGRTIAAYALKDLKLKRFGLLYNQQNSYSVTQVEPFIEYVNSHGGAIVARETFLTADKDYRTQLTKIKQTNPDALYLPIYPQEIPLAIQQAYDLGIKVTILGDNSFIPFSLANHTDPKASEGTYFPYGVDVNAPRLAEWGAEYAKKYGYPALSQSYGGWDQCGMLAEALRRAFSKNKNPNGDLIADEIMKTKDFQGYQGSITMSAETHVPVALRMYILQVKNGRAVTVTSYVPPQD